MKNPLHSSAFLFTVADTEALPLPTVLLDARDTAARLDAMTVDAVPHELEVAERAAHALVAGGDLDPSPVIAARADRERREAATRILDAGRDLAHQQLTDALTTHADEVIRECFAPAVADLAAELKTLHPVVGHLHTMGVEALLSQPKTTRDKYLRYTALADRHGAIMGARTRLYLTLNRQPQHDGMGWFERARNFEHLCPSILGQSHQHFVSELPTGLDARGLLAWMLDHDADLWCPTLEEQDARWLEVFADRVEQQRRNRHAVEGYRALGGVNGPTVPAAQAIAARLGG